LQLPSLLFINGLLTACSYEGKDSSKLEGGSDVYGGGEGAVIISREVCCVGLTIILVTGTFRRLVLVARAETLNLFN
jgi:hypothetical protein